jgi:polyhydroxybutyrate depolymerase
MKNFRGFLLTAILLIMVVNNSSCSPNVATAAAPLQATATSLPTPSPAPTITPGDSTRELEINGSNRKYYLHIPPGLDLAHPVPVVLFFQGLYTVSLTRSQTHFDEIADANHFVAVYPLAIGASWNAGGCCGIAAEDKVDEIAFVRQILSDLGTVVSIDPKRIYATGLYNGAMLSYRLACEMSDTFAAIASVAGTMLFSPCQPQQPVSIIQIHGLKDAYVPYAGGTSIESSLPQMPPVEQGIEAWTQFDACNGSPQSNVDGAITHTTYACKTGTAIELYTLDGLEGWPQPAGAGELNFPASQTIWDFFAAHPKS